MKLLSFLLMAFALIFLKPDQSLASPACYSSLADAVLQGLNEDIYQCEGSQAESLTLFCHDSAWEEHYLRRQCRRVVNMASGYRRLDRVRVSQEYSQPAVARYIQQRLSTEGPFRNQLAAFMAYKSLEKVKLSNHFRIQYRRMGRDFVNLPAHDFAVVDRTLQQIPTAIETILRLEALVDVEIDVHADRIPQDFDVAAVHQFFQENQEHIQRIVDDYFVRTITFSDSSFFSGYLRAYDNTIRLQSHTHSSGGKLFTMDFIEMLVPEEDPGSL